MELFRWHGSGERFETATLKRVKGDSSLYPAFLLLNSIIFRASRADCHAPWSRVLFQHVNCRFSYILSIIGSYNPTVLQNIMWYVQLSLENCTSPNCICHHFTLGVLNTSCCGYRIASGWICTFLGWVCYRKAGIFSLAQLGSTFWDSWILFLTSLWDFCVYQADFFICFLSPIVLFPQWPIMAVFRTPCILVL